MMVGFCHQCRRLIEQSLFEFGHHGHLFTTLIGRLFDTGCLRIVSPHYNTTYRFPQTLRYKKNLTTSSRPFAAEHFQLRTVLNGWWLSLI